MYNGYGEQWYIMNTYTLYTKASLGNPPKFALTDDAPEARNSAARE